MLGLGIDLNNDQEISYNEAAIVNSLDISTDGFMPINDITGIEAFISLDTLICRGNAIIAIDSLAQLPLKYLDCSWNDILSIQFNLPDLAYLNCSQNNISSLNASLFQNLKTLECDPSDSLIIENPLLEELYVESNVAINTNLAPELRKLICRTNSPPILNHNYKLTYLEIFDYPGQIGNIDLTNNIKLEHLYILSNLTSIDIANNPDLTYLNLKQNNLLALDLSKNPLIDTLICRSNNISSLDLSNNPKLLYVDCASNDIINLNLANLTKLKYLLCDGNQLSGIDVSKNSILEYLTCASNNLTGTIDLSQNINLQYLKCSDNKLQTLDFSNNINLTEIWCHENKLTNINVNNLTSLKGLHCFYNKLKHIDIHTNVALEWMQCSYNPLDSLDLSHSNHWSLVSLGGMPSLIKVCVSSLPVSYTINTTGSPNIVFDVCSFAGLQNNEIFSTRIYPNLTTGKVFIENTNPNNLLAFLYNINGILLFKTKLNTGVQNIDISHFPDGIYILKIFNNNNENALIRKIVKI